MPHIGVLMANGQMPSQSSSLNSLELVQVFLFLEKWNWKEKAEKGSPFQIPH